jgi:hypothetical protein
VSSVAHRWKPLSPAGHILRPCEGSTERETNSLAPYAIPILTSRIAFNRNFDLLMKGIACVSRLSTQIGHFPGGGTGSRAIRSGHHKWEAQHGPKVDSRNRWKIFAHSAALCPNDRAPGRAPREISRPFLMPLRDACVPVDRFGNIFSSWRRPQHEKLRFSAIIVPASRLRHQSVENSSGGFGHQLITPRSHSSSISESSSPSTSDKTSAVCSPKSGGAKRYVTGVLESLIGLASRRTADPSFTECFIL